MAHFPGVSRDCCVLIPRHVSGRRTHPQRWSCTPPPFLGASDCTVPSSSGLGIFENGRKRFANLKDPPGPRGFIENANSYTPTTGTLTKWDRGRAQASAFLTLSPGGSDAGDPRIAHLESLVSERAGPGADTLLPGSWHCQSLSPPWGPPGRSGNPRRIRGPSTH